MVLFLRKKCRWSCNPSLHIVYDALYFVPSFVKISHEATKLFNGHYFQTEIFKGVCLIPEKHRSNYVFFNLCTSSDDPLYLYKVS